MSFEEWVIEKYHGLVKDEVRKNINGYDIKIRFTEPSYVIKEIYGGFLGRVHKRQIVLLGTEEFGVRSVEKDKKKQCSTINVWNDGVCDGWCCRLINVPNGLFKQVDND